MSTTTTPTIDYSAPKLAPDLISLITLAEGAHKDRAHGLCVMEAAAWLAGEPHSDSPSCASRLVSGLARRLNDRFGQDMRDALRDRLPQIVGSKAAPEIEKKRALEFIYLLVSQRLPASLDALAANPKFAAFKDRCMASAAELRALTREDGPDRWRAAAQPARATIADVRSEFPAYADADADADAYAYAYAYAEPAKRTELKAALQKDALAMLDAILAIRE